MRKIVKYQKGKGFLPIKGPYKFDFQILLAEDAEDLASSLILLGQSNDLDKAIKRGKKMLSKQEHTATIYIMYKGRTCKEVLPYLRVYSK